MPIINIHFNYITNHVFNQEILNNFTNCNLSANNALAPFANTLKRDIIAAKRLADASLGAIEEASK